ncbi:MAG: type II toxin-antitoxin system HicB family antitoxin [Alphaproteobacteria bacterium]
MSKTTYPAIIFEDDGQIGVMFPDLPNCVCMGSGIDDAIYKAGEVLFEHLEMLYETGNVIPMPSDKKKVKLPPSFGRKNYSVVMITAGLNYQADIPPHW